MIERADYRNYQDFVRQRGEALLNRAEAPRLLEQLKARISDDDHPEVRVVGPNLTAGGTVEMCVQWDFRPANLNPSEWEWGLHGRKLTPDEAASFTFLRRYTCNFVSVAACPLTDELEIWGERQTVLSKFTPERLQQAIEDAYKSGNRMYGGPDRDVAHAGQVLRV